MSDTDVKQVKVDNWGIYFLQRLKHFFNRTDYCDLTLQFQDNAQLKVHRLVLSACTEYFELLERTCEMYEDCLVMPDDLQADVVVPIVNFMYTGQLEFRMDLVERLYLTSQIMQMPVLTKLLEAHRNQAKPARHYNSTKRFLGKTVDLKSKTNSAVPSSSNTYNKRSYGKAFGGNSIPLTDKKQCNFLSAAKADTSTNNGISYPASINTQKAPRKGDTETQSKRFDTPSDYNSEKSFNKKKFILSEPRPTRYELPVELDSGNIFSDSFTNISYTMEPLMVHPETSKHYSNPKKTALFSEPSSSSQYERRTTVDIVECKKIKKSDNIFEDDVETLDDSDIFHTSRTNILHEPLQNSNQLFDQIIDQDDGPKVTIETKDNKQSNNVDHAKIISEVLKKYPHLVKSKNIKLKILNTPNVSNTGKIKKVKKPVVDFTEEVKVPKLEVPDYTYETDVIDSKQAAKLIAMGAENIKGPWICLICGAPGKALHFTSYYKFRRHLVEIHNEKPISSMCEYCGLKSLKRNYLLHHLYTKHNIPPPPSYHFPKCNLCNYIALTEGFLIKHKLSHAENRSFRCNVCVATYTTSSQLLEHIQLTGHKYSGDRKTNLQCVYCLKVFLRETSLYTHLKTQHKAAAKSDGIIDDSDEEIEEKPMLETYKSSKLDKKPEIIGTQYQIKSDGNIEIITKTHVTPTRNVELTPTKQKILNAGFEATIVKTTPQNLNLNKKATSQNELLDKITISANHTHNEEIVMIDDIEYIMKDNQLIPLAKSSNEDYIMSDTIVQEDETLTSTSINFSNVQDSVTENLQDHKMIIKNRSNVNQPIQIMVSNEEEYKALINSNHPILFDELDANKTLTVLSTSHGNSISTTGVTLSETQTNDMMVIPENYQLNVSEALPADNNIVVVYSHAVDDQNKQYQLITTQDIDTQFVQASTVITQNYQTINTSSPVVSAHVIESPLAETWQNSNEVVQTEQITSISANQEITIVDDPKTDGGCIQTVDIATTSSQAIQPEDVNMDDNVNQTVIVSIGQTQNNIESTEANNISSQNDVEKSDKNAQETSAETVQIDNSHNVPEDDAEQIQKDKIDAMQEDNLEKSQEENVNEVIVEEVQITVMDTEESSELITHEDIPTDEPNVIETSISENVDAQTSAPNYTMEIVEITKEVEPMEGLSPPQEADVENDESLQEANVEEENNIHTENVTVSLEEIDQPEVQVLQEHTNDIEISTDKIEEIKPASVAKEQIQTLTSEWSEDEYDVESQEENVTEEVSETKQTEPEIEESIESIQQEIDKPPGTSEIDTEESIASSQDDTTSCLHETEQGNMPAIAPKEKISALLNDWEDNDSQEGNESGNDAEEVEQQVVIAETIESDVTGDKTAQDVTTDHPKPSNDKIKSLVSDWDEDEEENKS